MSEIEELRKEIEFYNLMLLSKLCQDQISMACIKKKKEATYRRLTAILTKNKKKQRGLSL